MNTPETFHRVVAVGVDIQNDFCPGGSLAVAEGDLVVPAFNKVAQWVRQQRGIVAYTRDWHPEVTNHFADYGGVWPVHCVADTYGAQFKEGLDVRDGDPILSKGTLKDEDAYSGFQGKDHDGMTLETLLTPTRGERAAVVIGGLATDYCDKATVLDALDLERRLRPPTRQLGVFVLTDAMRAVNIKPKDGENALKEMEAAGAILITTNQLVNDHVIEVRS